MWVRNLGELRAVRRRVQFGLAVVVTVLAGMENHLSAEQPRASITVDVGRQVRTLVEADWLQRDRLFAVENRRPGQPVTVNSLGVTTAQDAAGAVDGTKNGRFGFHVAVGETDPWWQVDLGKDYKIDRIVVYNRTDGGHASRTRNIAAQVARDADCDRFETIYRHDGTVFHGLNEKKPLVINLQADDVSARIVRLHVPGVCHLALDEVEIYPASEPQENIALGKPADQKSVSRHSRASSDSDVDTTRDGGFLLAHTRRVVQRAHDLAARLRYKADPSRLDPLVAELAKIDRRLTELEADDATPPDVRRAVYFDARWLARKIAFSNRLLDFDKLMFIKRRHPNFQHICDQYYGLTAEPGGGLFVLLDPFGDSPKLTDLLADSPVEGGRLEGRKLVGGSFLSPELSYDARTILLAYTEAADQEHFTTEAESNRRWTPENCYHVFKVNTDGSRLEQLTDGATNDFDPCFLPNGRIAFISERRGGHVRCGIRDCRSFNLCSMRPDGGDISILSYHDTNEWHPSVNNEGMIVYTRWDYIDRDTQIAHHIWTTTPDGRDPRAYHGNYPARRADRPWTEMDIRAIPGSPRYVATAAPHHGQSFGSLIWIDLRPEDDDHLSQVTRLTPEVPFPEAEGSIRQNMIYGTPWPLDEDDYLSVYDRHARNHAVYWIDRFGNKELIYGDPEIPCYSPIPIVPRVRPPVISNPSIRADTLRRQKTTDDENRASATIGLVNVYDADFQWPEGELIESLRVIEILPKATPSRNKPRVGIAEQTNARTVLGSVPVEADGSAYFEAPAGKLIYFQALDARQMAVQSMRSGTYVHAGQRLTCQGCHERKHGSPPPRSEMPLAFKRPPSAIEPDCQGSNPFSYVRMVQPVLDRNCVECHRQEKALELSGEIEIFVDRDKNRCRFTRSYNNLAEKYGFWFHALNNCLNAPDGHGGSRTTAGAFGARASKLLPYLDQRHHGVNLSPGDFHRVTLWLDCNSEFLGGYEYTDGQTQGKVAGMAGRNR